MSRPVVALDVTPLVGPRTGIASSVEGILKGLRGLGGPTGVDDVGGVDDVVGLDDVGGLEGLKTLAGVPTVLPYVLGAPRHRHSLPAGARLVPVPARVALGAWSRLDQPRVDRWLPGAEVLHATNFVVPPSRLPTLTTVHDCSFALVPDTVAPHVHAFGPVLRRALGRGAHVHTATEQVADEVEELFAPGLRAQGRLHVVPFGLPAPGPAGGVNPVPPGAPYVLALGRVEPRKNLPALLRALPGVPGVRLVIAGPDGAGRPAVDEALAALPARDRDRVLRLGPVDGAVKRALLENALALAYPSLYEGFGFPVLEAMALGTPVLTANIPALREVTGGCALLVDPLDDQAVGAGLLRLAETGGVELLDAARQHAAAFTWGRTAAGLAHVYDQLLV